MLGSPRFPWNPSALMVSLAYPPHGTYPYKNPFYIRPGVISGLTTSTVEVAFEDGSVSGWLMYDQPTGRGFALGHRLEVLYQDAAMTKPFQFVLGRGGYVLEQPHNYAGQVPAAVCADA